MARGRPGGRGLRGDDPIVRGEAQARLASPRAKPMRECILYLGQLRE